VSLAKLTVIALGLSEVQVTVSLLPEAWPCYLALFSSLTFGLAYFRPVTVTCYRPGQYIMT
jgi:hypothetical protein